MSKILSNYDINNFAFQNDNLARLGEYRTDSKFIEQKRQSNKSRFIFLYQQSFVIEQAIDEHTNQCQLVLLDKQDFNNTLIEQSITFAKKHLIYLGQSDDKHYFAYRLKQQKHLEYLINDQANRQIQNLRSSVTLLAATQAYLANVAVALTNWHSSHQYCGFCGALSYSNAYGYVRSCSNNDCLKDHFPRTDPAVIVAITHIDQQGKERILLGRQASWPQGRYSIIAGFVEPGESLEQSVKREALEETGIEVDDVEYIASQPWLSYNI